MSEFQHCLRCEKPVIIRNPYAFALLDTHNCYVIKGSSPHYIPDHLRGVDDYYYKITSPTYNHVTTSYDVERSYILDMNNGERYPLFYEVPCGKCALCRDKKVSDWKCRAMCETAVSKHVPFFVTLTYRNEELPIDGVNKYDVQCFLKRLRSYLSYHGYDEPIRYFAVGEYGKQKGRPHYHLIIWHTPCDSTHDMLKLMEQCWDKGFCYVVACNQYKVGYVMKYMRKECNQPSGKNPVFYLASRNKAIGLQYLEDNLQYFLDNPSMSFQVYDKFNNEVSKFGLPQYFVRKIYPTLCNIIPKEIRDSYARFCEIRNSLKKLAGYYMRDDIRWFLLTDKFCFLPSYNWSQMKFVKDISDTDRLIDEWYRLEKILINYQLPSNLYELLDRQIVRKELVRQYIESHPYTTENRSADLFKIKNSIIRQERRQEIAEVPF